MGWRSDSTNYLTYCSFSSHVTIFFPEQLFQFTVLFAELLCFCWFCSCTLHYLLNQQFVMLTVFLCTKKQQGM